MFLRVSVVEPQGGVQSDGDPDAVPHPGHLAHLTLLPGVSVQRGLHTHQPGVQYVDPVPVAQPDLGVDLDHGPDGVVGPAQVQQVVVGEVPLAARLPVEYCHGPVSQGGQHPALHVPAMVGGGQVRSGQVRSGQVRDNY